jgi:hypothetical protein
MDVGAGEGEEVVGGVGGQGPVVLAPEGFLGGVLIFFSLIFACTLDTCLAGRASLWDEQGEKGVSHR